MKHLRSDSGRTTVQCSHLNDLMAQSSSSFNYAWTYDVFLNFRGEDTRAGFVGNLYKALSDKGIHTFIDDNGLERGEHITPSLLKAINDSRTAITVFSKNYAQSTFCLEELVEILECLKQKGRQVWPVFYDINPSTVRHFKESYGEALAKHHKIFCHNKRKVQRWKWALAEASNLSGWHFKPGCEYEFQFIEIILKEVSKKINRLPLHIAKYPVGLELRVHKVISLLNAQSNKGVKMVGIYGIPGLGKTTIARVVYNLIADNFESICFLGDIRFNACKHGLTYLQETLLSELVGEKDIKLQDVNKGIPIIKRRLCRKKVLLILDNVNKLEQLQAIIGEHDWFGSGSTVIITTRDKHLLDVHGIKRQYKAELLNHEEALELLCWNAFKTNQISPIYEDVSNRVLRYCKGLPIALEIIGSNLFGRSLDEWNSTLDTYRRTPIKNVQEILRESYDVLDEKEKEIFLDIACFFKGQNLRDVKNILSNGRGFQPNYCIGVLIEKSLIQVEREIVIMHDLIEDMGKEIVRQQSPLEPGKCSRLWFDEDIIHVLEENTGTDKIEVMVLDLPKTKEVRWNGKAFKKMKNVKMLIIKNAHFSIAPVYLPNCLKVLVWPEYPSSSLPSNFHPDKLVQLDMINSCFILDEPLKNFMSMKKMNLSSCELIERFPDVSGMPNLIELKLSHCRKLIEVDDSVGFLRKLEFLNASGCTKLRTFPNAIASTSLEYLNLSGCSSLESFPETFEIMDYIEDISLQPRTGWWNNLRLVLPNKRLNHRLLLCSSIMVPKIEKLMKRFKRLRKSQGEDQERMNSSVSSKFMRSLIVQDCSLIDKYLSPWLGFFPDIRALSLPMSNVTDEHLVKGLPLFPNLELLDLSKTRITMVPECINGCHFLRKIDLSYCTQLQEIRGVPPNTELLALTNTAITMVPECIKECHFLTTLYLNGCRQLEEIRGVPPNIKTLFAEGCKALSAQSRSILLSETVHERGGTVLILPGARIPEWFDHIIHGSSLSFWFRNKFPMIALCFSNHDNYGHRFRVFINGIQQAVDIFVRYNTLPARHIYLLHFHGSYVLDNKRGAEFRQDAWNHVEIRTSFSSKPHQDEIGIYIHKKQSSTEDFRFTNPKPRERRYPLRKHKKPRKSPIL